MSARAADIGKLTWGWKICFQDDSFMCLVNQSWLQEASVPYHFCTSPWGHVSVSHCGSWFSLDQLILERGQGRSHRIFYVLTLKVIHHCLCKYPIGYIGQPYYWGKGLH